jgi:hypothetical protein
MIDLDQCEIEVSCPTCGFYEPVTLKQIRLGDVVVCRGCKSNMRLIDHMHEVAKARKAIRRQLDALAEYAQKTITLRF